MRNINWSCGAPVLAAAFALSLAAMAQAQSGTFSPPEGCEAYLTLQQRTCRVSHFWTCEADMPGDRWRVDIGPNGPVFLSKIDSETQWIESYDLFPTVKKTLILPAADPASFSELLAEGVDTFDFRLAVEGGGEEHVVGFDRIVEKGVVIDGEPLMRTNYAARVTDGEGNLIYEAEGSEYISEKYRQFFAGYGTFTNPEGSFPYDFSPVEFVHPGEEGFLARRPKYDCEGITAQAVPVVPASLVAPAAPDQTREK